MKKKVLPFIGLLLISVLSATILSSCDKDTWCYLEVTVLDSKKDNMPAPGAWIRVRYTLYLALLILSHNAMPPVLPAPNSPLLPSSPSLPALTNPTQLTTNTTTAKANAPSASNQVKW